MCVSALHFRILISVRTADAIRRYVETMVDCGYDYFLAYDHVLGADTTNRPGWTGYTKDNIFHEIFTLFGYVAALAPDLELVSSVVILPQRQTALVAKQAAADRHSDRREVPARRRRRLERGRVRGARRGLQHPRPRARGADRAAARLWTEPGDHLARRVRYHHRGRD